jgi:cytidylate kinase
MIRVITLAREHGSGGHEIAQRVAATLAWQIVDQRIVEDVARAAHVASEDVGAVDERVEPWLVRVGRSFWSATPEGFTQPVDEDVMDADRIAALTRRVIEEAAARGSCVIVGRGAQCALAGRDDVLRVFVYAPLEARRARLAQRLPPGGEPSDDIAKVDRARRAYVKHYYGRSWDARSDYQLMIDSSLGIERAARVILAAAHPPESAP